jgi:hypothetical protein
VPEIRLDVRLLRPGALVAGVAAGRCVLVRAVPDAGAAVPWMAARAAGLPVPEVREARCGERLVLVVAPAAGRPLSPGGAGGAVAQAATLGAALLGHGIAVSRLSASNLQMCDGVLAVRAPVAGPPGEAAGEVAAFVATVAAACATEAVAPVPRHRRAVRLSIAGAAVLAVLVTVVPQREGVAPAQPRAVVVAPASVSPVVEPAADPLVTPRVRRPATRRPEAAPTAPAKKRKRPKVAPAVAGAPALPRPAPPAQRRAVEPPGDDIPAAGGDADPVPAL